MDIDCGFCKGKFILAKEHIKKELAEENPIVKGFMESIFGKQNCVAYKYFIYCPHCHKKIAKFD